MTERLSTGGEKVFLYGMRGLGGYLGAVVGVIIFFTTVLAMALDISLGPFFFYAQAEARNKDVDFWGHVIFWITSVATTGLLYALWQHAATPLGGSKVIRAIAVFLMLADGFSDLGGFNAQMLNHPEAGTRVFLTPQDSWAAWVFNVGVFLLCVFHEPLLGTVLSRRWATLKGRTVGGLGDKIENSCVWLAGLVFNTFKTFAIWMGAIAMIGLDILLAPQLGSGWTKVGFFVFSLAAFGLLVTWWRYYHHVGSSGIRSLTRIQKAILVGCIAFMLADSGVDLAGLNNLLYGSPSLIVPQPTVAWAITFSMIAVMCTANEPLSSEIFRPLQQLFGLKSNVELEDLAGLPGMGGVQMVELDNLPGLMSDGRNY